MRLEKITLNGFKSFADKTELAFDSSITAIVGPNGCGKSNIVDAVKWVLGEQSVKSLRSGQMSDVIFSGSSSRKPATTAEVSLLISNTTGQLPIEAEQVQISRRIYKSGESEYRINNKTCRLKDVRELFMDTGIGVKAYSIIEQGQVEQLLNSSKTDRRIIFEEAAGISKYKAHKKEALRKLERTEQNLLRLADILGEIQKQLRSVKLAAGKARNYLQYSERLKNLQVNYCLAEFDKLSKTTREKRNSLEELQAQFASAAAQVARYDGSLSTLGQEIIETENRINSTDNSLVSVKSKIAQQLQRIEFLRARAVELQQRNNGAGQRAEKLTDQQRLFEADLKQYETEQSNCEKSLEEKNRTIEQLQETIKQTAAECDSLSAELEDEKSGIIDIVRKTAQLHNDVQSNTVYRTNLSSQKDRLSSRADTAKSRLEQLVTAKAQYRARLADIEKVLGELQANLNLKQKQAEETIRFIEADNKKLSASREARSALAGELAILLDLENKREGLTNAVKYILEGKSAESNRFNYIEGLLADIIIADVEYAYAVEAALEGRTNCLIVNDSRALLDNTEEIEKLDSRVDFLCADKTGPFVENIDLSEFSSIKGRLAEFVRTESKYAPLIWHLLGKTLLVDSIDTAVEMTERLPAEYNFVTLQGEFVSGRGTIKLGPVGAATGLISRKSRIRQLEQVIAGIDEQTGQLTEQIEKHKLTNIHIDKLCKELRTSIYEAKTEHMQTSSRLAAYQQDIKRLSEEQPLIAGEIKMLETRLAELVQKEYDSKQKLQELEAVNSQRTKRIEHLRRQYEQQKELQQTQLAQLTDLKVSLGQTAEQNKALKQTIVSVQNQMRANLTAIKTAQEEIQSCTEQHGRSEREILSCESAVSQLFVDKEGIQRNSRQLHGTIEKLLEEQKQTEQLIRARRTEQTEIEQKISEFKVELGQLDVRTQALAEKVRDELQIDLQDAYEDYIEGQVNWDGIREEIAELRGKIERLGNVNLDAIGQQEGLEQRSEFLSSQVEDLNKSKLQLQQLISRLNKKSREKFEQTFEDVRLGFQQIFRKLFGGGKADVLLEDGDILEAGIEIIARPPGKHTRSISLLSGGEKALTAISLLFAVFRTKPSPFCFLDEIDAALDEANNERFNMLLREFQKDSQFIVITHAKRTMSVADVLYGITMQSRGVSKKISVHFDQLEQPEEAETAAVA